MSHQQEFIERVAPHAMRDMKETGILASLTIAQAILESGWGDSTLARPPHHNLFGIKASRGWSGKTVTLKTKEYIRGEWVTVPAQFRSYPSYYESIQDHTRLLTTLDRYQNLIGVTDYKRACVLIHKDGYATDPEYPQKLIHLIEKYKLYEYDQQAIQEQEAERQVSPFARDSWEFVKAFGISDGSRPQMEAPRQQVWVMIHRTMELVQQILEEAGFKVIFHEDGTYTVTKVGEKK